METHSERQFHEVLDEVLKTEMNYLADLRFTKDEVRNNYSYIYIDACNHTADAGRGVEPPTDPPDRLSPHSAPPPS